MNGPTHRPDGAKPFGHNDLDHYPIGIPHVRSTTVSYFQLEQLAMLDHREACSQARQARLARLARGARRSSRAAQAAAPAVAKTRLVPSPR